MKLSSSWPGVASINWSIRGKRKPSLGHALLRFVKLTYSLHFPLGFFTNTGLESQTRVIGLSNKIYIEKLIYLFFHSLSEFIGLQFCLTG